VAGRRSANDRRQVNAKAREAQRLASRPVAPVVVRYVCPRCGGSHPRDRCPRR
jgi:ribosomal protein L44E